VNASSREPLVRTTGSSRIVQEAHDRSTAGRGLDDIRMLTAPLSARKKREEKAVAASGLFDAGFYVACHALTGGGRANPLRHFVAVGVWKDLSPHPLFDLGWYRATSSLRGRKDVNAFLHYLAATNPADRRPHPLFDGAFYLETNPDVARTSEEPLKHFLEQGAREGRNPHPLFDCSFYLKTNPDVAASGINPLVHFVLHGAREGRAPHRDFDPEFYLRAYPDVRASGMNPLVHYVTAGSQEGRDPSAEARARRTAKAIRVPAPERTSRTRPVVREEPALPEPDDVRVLFHAGFYLDRNRDVRDAGIDPLAHYLGGGWREDRDPHPLFSRNYYLEQSRDSRPEQENPLAHFLRAGGIAGLDPHPLFDSSFYLDANPELRSRGVNPLVHYLKRGAAEGRAPNSWFDGDFYRQFYNDVSPENPLVHYARVGYAAGRHTQRETRNAEDWHRDYLVLGRLLAERRRRRIEEFRPTAVEMVHVREEDLPDVAGSLRFDATDEPLVSILIPVFNQVRLTVECLLSLRAMADDVPYEVIVADDASTDATRDLLADVPGIHYLRSDENRGFLRNCNSAAKTARGIYLLLLNNDAQVLSGCLTALVSTFRERSDAGAVGPKVLFPDGRLQEAGARVLPDGTTRFVGVFEDPAQPGLAETRRVDYCSGVCLLVKRADFERLGGFDDALAPSYCEDLDLCLRLQEDGLFVYCNPEAVVVHHLSATTRLLPDDYKNRCVLRNRQTVIERHWETIRRLNEVKVVAFYLPQYHPIPENDRWWGKGFTEWRNVVRGRPNFEGHLQPRLPADLGFYDLRLDETVREQWRLARRYGISAFCYHYYWFAGKRLLEEPLERLLRMSGPKLPFCLSWANENWTRTWDGGGDEVLLGQRHDPSDDRAVIRDLIRYFRDPDYVHVEGRPLFIVYRYDLFPDMARTIRIWRAECRRAGIATPYLVANEACDLAFRDVDPRAFGFDAAVEFPPHGVGTEIKPPGRVLNPAFRGQVFDYRAAAARFASRPAPAYKRFHGIFPGWDNTARRPDVGHIFAFSSPGTYRAWLEEIAERTREESFGDERLIFVNAWNEWAEGCYLEPDLSNGHSFLEATRAALDGPPAPRT
jgi:GT2 family glycosyltransferase